jgi:coproporphyrinogen III oxidase-like Fe-S oxidoreductase
MRSAARRAIKSSGRKLLTGTGRLVLEATIPSLENAIRDIDAFGLYLHIPFCHQICPYCPYNKVIYHPEMAQGYTQAVLGEIDIYAALVGKRPVTSFYIGGGTPTTMLYSGLDRILDHVFNRFNMKCGIHMESHPNDLSRDNLNAILSMGVDHLSIGVEALQDHHLRTLHRPYTVAQVRKALQRAVGKHFKCVNADLIFALPNQTVTEIAQAGHALVQIGVDQVAAYPLFELPYTRWAEIRKRSSSKKPGIFKRRHMLRALEAIFYAAGFERTSVWAFTRAGVPRYCSVTVPLYIGLGASGGSYLKDVFYLNTFNVQEYIRSLEKGRLPIALSLELSKSMQMAGWVYWRVYETRINKSEFGLRFGKDLDKVYGSYIRLLSLLGLLKEEGDQVVLTDRGAFWLHALQDVFSIDYIAKLWGTSVQDPWPNQVVL